MHVSYPAPARPPHSPVNNSFPIGRLFGIQLRVHVLFVYLSAGLIFLGASKGSGITTAAFLGMLVVLVLLHELGHARVAQHFGVTVVDIVLWPLGGMARMSALPEEPRVEGLVAIAGPLVNLTLAALGSLGLLLIDQLQLIELTEQLENVNPLEGQLVGLQSILALFVMANLMLGLFNLIPAFPMDGGRILRAFLGRKRPWLEATEGAVKVSRIVAVMMIIGSFMLPRSSCFLPLIGLYILFEGTRELWMTRLRHSGGAFMPAGTAGPGAGPGIDLTELFRRAREAQMRGDAGGPPGQESFPGQGVERGPSSPGGFSDEDVQDLERFRGRLKRPGDEE